MESASWFMFLVVAMVVFNNVGCVGGSPVNTTVSDIIPQSNTTDSSKHISTEEEVDIVSTPFDPARPNTTETFTSTKPFHNDSSSATNTELLEEFVSTISNNLSETDDIATTETALSFDNVTYESSTIHVEKKNWSEEFHSISESDMSLMSSAQPTTSGNDSGSSTNSTSDEFHCHEFPCNNTKKCISKTLFCNGIDNCGDNSDEENCPVNEEIACPWYVCNNTLESNCLPWSRVCDRIEDCEDGSDEIDCHCHTRCDSRRCLSTAQLCDGVADCHDGSDEDSCYFLFGISYGLIIFSVIGTCVVLGFVIIMAAFFNSHSKPSLWQRKKQTSQIMDRESDERRN